MTHRGRRGPCQSSSSASPTTSRALGNGACSRARSRSFSIATTRPARSSSAAVSPPGPGTDLEHRVVRRGTDRIGDACEDPGIGEEMLAEPPLALDAHDQSRMTRSVRSSAAARQRVGFREHRAHESPPPAGSRRLDSASMQPRLAVALPVLIGGIHQAVGPEAEQVALHVPRQSAVPRSRPAQPAPAAGGRQRVAPVRPRAECGTHGGDRRWRSAACRPAGRARHRTR